MRKSENDENTERHEEKKGDRYISQMTLFFFFYSFREPTDRMKRERGADEYFDGGNFQRLQSARAFSAHELIAGCAAAARQSGYRRRYRVRITEISSRY